MSEAPVQEYEVLLRRFVRTCEDLVKDGRPYLSVVLCHELSRFLYPAEPYLSFKHSQPVHFMKKKIRELIEWAEFSGKAVGRYPAAFPLNGRWAGGEGLEKRTSDLYSELWQDFDEETLWRESLNLLRSKLPAEVIRSAVVNKRVLDMGCGSGRYAIALARLGAREVLAVDFQRKSFAKAQSVSRKRRLPIRFREANFLSLPFKEGSFDFVFCNGVLHHSRSIEKGLWELKRVLKEGGKAFLYLYGAGGIFWKTRSALRRIFKQIPLSYTRATLELMGTPPKRFIFCDTWYVPRETHTPRKKLEGMLRKLGFSFRKVVSQDPFDLNRPLQSALRGARAMWGDGENRYLLEKEHPEP